MHISEMESKIDKKSSVFEIKVFEVVGENLDIAAGRVVIGGQCVSKHS